MIPTERAHLEVAAQSHPGMSGKNNEDRYAVSAFQLSREDTTPALLAVLCDGIGGHRAGEVAAELAVNAITQGISASDAAYPVEILRRAVVAASEQIYESAQAEPGYRGMGATCATTLIVGQRLYAAAVGDSRIYLLRAGQIHQLTTDHTWIQEALDRGVLRPEQARGHPNAHVIRRYLGSPTPPEVDFRLRLRDEETAIQAEENQGLGLLPGDRLLLCSDGLTDLVSAPEILATINSQPPQAAANSLVEQANARGGHDNITVVILGVPESAKTRPIVPLKKRSNRSWLLLGCAGLLVLVLAAAALLFGMGILAVGPLFPGTPTPTPTLPPFLQTVLPPSGTQPPGPVPFISPSPSLPGTFPAPPRPGVGTASP